MGFRGEALASMTYVAHVTVTTITKGKLHGYRCWWYLLSDSGDDYSKIVDLLSRFAIHHMNVSSSCRKHGAARADANSVSTASRIDAIRSVYVVSVARNLMKIEASDKDPCSSVFQMDGFISDSNYVAKKMTMIDCTALKRAVEVVYAATLPKASKPFIYMSIMLPPEHVDVNVHPTKREVSLLNQEIIIEKIQSVVEWRLRGSNETHQAEEQKDSIFGKKRENLENGDGGFF
ncbi:hypothetical protein TB1_007919 [Malus domestica]